MCFEIVGLEESKLAAIAPAVKGWAAKSINMALLVGSANAWNTSLLNFIVLPFGYKYKRSHLATQIFLRFFMPEC